MRRSLIVLSLIFALVPFVLKAQERYLVSPSNEVIRLAPGENALAAMRSRRNSPSGMTGFCPDKFVFGHQPEAYPSNGSLSARHRDVIAQHFTAPATGTIDAIHWLNGWNVGAYNSTVFLRIHRSAIGREYGPGVRPGPFAPPCRPWGYWVNTNDLDQGIAAFPDDATDTTWVSTYVGGTVPTRPPIGEELWGFGGFPVQLHANGVSSASMADLAAPVSVAAGDEFFVSLRIAAANDSVGGHLDPESEPWTDFNMAEFAVGTNDPDYPSRNWKFYEHDHGPSTCSDLPISEVSRGWVARGSGGDTLEVSAFNIWYEMTVTTNLPPVIADDDRPRVALCCQPFNLSYQIDDCDPAAPAMAGVDSVLLELTIDGVPQVDLPFVHDGGSVWTCEIPAPAGPSFYRYRVRAVDREGSATFTAIDSVRFVALRTDRYAIYVADVAPQSDMVGGGTRLPLGAFFVGPAAPPESNPRREGTAGPFYLGGPFIAFGDTFHYAWIGVDGALTLTASATDTADVNPDGMFHPEWNLPYPSVDNRYGPPGNMPRIFVAPFYRDFVYINPSVVPNRIRYGEGTDGCTFIVAWDSVLSATSNSDEWSSFRAVLDRCDGTVAFQYSVLPGEIRDPYLVGMQNAARDDGALFVNRQSYPVETRPGAGRTILLVPRTTNGVAPVAGTPSTFALSQNYPNPFNPTTTIPFTIPVAGEVRLRVYDVLGRLAATLVDGFRTAGYHTAPFEGTDLPSGVYVCRIEAGTFAAQRKLLLVR